MCFKVFFKALLNIYKQHHECKTLKILDTYLFKFLVVYSH